jgi:hypothetical protein
VTSIKKKKHFIERARTVLVVAMLCMIVGGVAGYSLYPRGFYNFAISMYCLLIGLVCYWDITRSSIGWLIDTKQKVIVSILSLLVIVEVENPVIRIASLLLLAFAILYKTNERKRWLYPIVILLILLALANIVGIMPVK